ncbi:hypothetical protein [Legionella pneumophila]|uniref:hypothetical protein n=2 Tax=Legionella pneumophila TaxID=446 RepID=UPI00048BA03C|nr:hypothetical protein [Legionella pneumophila]RYW23111.1 hypothetical protein D7234_14575 [Legionella pneumophila]CZJ15090.1 Uncharacterised protein [Legionella pneumophila]CZJ27826.1 Uncharacterised protein [Legionella pneumophila]CZJ27912.1 Uncharacterised protein [Legionella pneumophila]CZJ28274.1 Uncharacterised protein [Legionella pneumophila]
MSDMEIQSGGLEVTSIGSTVTPVYAKRNIKIFAIPESELEILSSMSTDVTIFYSVFSFFLSMTIALFLSGIFADKLEENMFGKFLFCYGTPTALVLAVLFLGIAVYKHSKRKNLITIIKQESVIS